MSRIIQVYDEEKQINTQVSRFQKSINVLSHPTEAPRNVFALYLSADNPSANVSSHALLTSKDYLLKTL